MKIDDRLVQLTAWVRQFDGLESAEPKPASADASFRRYFRVEGSRTCIVMDAPPGQEDCGPFIAVASYLENMGLNSPRVLEADLEQGFLLLTDLGSTPYLNEINVDHGRAPDLYRDAVTALSVMQDRGREFQPRLPPYDERLLRFELSLFRDWLCDRHLELRLSAAEEAGWQGTCDLLVGAALQQPRVFVHRDYHSRNLMVTPEDNPGILDFQDAVEGPYTYDLVSLLKDCYVKWPAGFIAQHAMHFFRHLPRESQSAGETAFVRDFDLVGVQRHLKAAGIFARLLHRDGKPGYLQDVPRTLSYIEDVAPGYTTLGALGALIAERVRPALELRAR